MNGSVTDLSVEIIVYDWNAEQPFKYIKKQYISALTLLYYPCHMKGPFLVHFDILLLDPSLSFKLFGVVPPQRTSNKSWTSSAFYLLYPQHSCKGTKFYLNQFPRFLSEKLIWMETHSLPSLNLFIPSRHWNRTMYYVVDKFPLTLWRRNFTFKF